MGSAGVEASLTFSGLKFRLNGEVIASAKVKLSMLEQYMSDGLHSGVTELVTNKLVDASSEALQVASGAKKPEVVVKADLSKKEKEVVAGMVEQESVIADMNAHPVALELANKLYQPVRGTSSGSKYFSVAIGDVNIGVRVNKKGEGFHLSVRAEGKVQEHASELVLLGLGDNGSYWSSHFDVDDELLMKKTIGSLLFGSGLTFRMVATDMKKLIGAGQ